MLPFGSVARYQLLYIIIISNLAKQSTWKSTVKRDITEDKKLLNTRSNVFIFLNQKEVLPFIFDLTLINSIVCLYLCVGEGGGEGEGGGGWYIFYFHRLVISKMIIAMSLKLLRLGKHSDYHIYMKCCAIWYNLYNLKNVKDTHGRVFF